MNKKAFLFYQLLFSKKEEAIYIPQIYLSYLFFRLLKVCGVEFFYTEGFNPKPKARFIYPLSVGVGGEKEYFYFYAYNVPSQIEEKVNKILPKGLKVLSVEISPWKKVSENLVESADYELKLREKFEVFKELPQCLEIFQKADLTYNFRYYYGKGMKFFDALRELTGKERFSNIDYLTRKKLNFRNKFLDTKEAQGRGKQNCNECG